MTSARDVTSSMLAPDGSLPTMLSPLERRRSKTADVPRARRTAAAGGSISGCSAVGTQTSVAPPGTGPANAGGATPMSV